MSSEPESPNELPALHQPPQAAGDAMKAGRAPLFQEPASRMRSRALIATAGAAAIAIIAYAVLSAPAEDGGPAFTPPAGLTPEETPHWLQTLCADRTRELCAAADRARQASDCESMRAALRSLEAVERKLSSRGAVSSRQRWVLIELYGQGHELCQFERGGAEK